MTNTAENRKHDLNATIEFEIRRIEAYEAQAGWNTWILIGALSTVTSFLFVSLERGGNDFKIIAYLFIGWSLIYDWFKMIITEVSRSNLGPSRIFPANNVLSFGRVGLVFVILRSILLIWLVLYFNFGTTLWLAVLFYIVYGVSITVNLISSYSANPVITNHRRPSTWVILILFILGIPYQLYKMLLFLPIGNNTLLLENFKISGLLAVIVAILMILAERQIRRQLINRLESLFISLNTGLVNEIDLQKLLSQFLVGMTPENYLEKDIENLETSVKAGDPFGIRKSALVSIRKVLTLQNISAEFTGEVATLARKIKTLTNTIPDEIKDQVENFWYKAYMDYLDRRLEKYSQK